MFLLPRYIVGELPDRVELLIDGINRRNRFLFERAERHQSRSRRCAVSSAPVPGPQEIDTEVQGLGLTDALQEICERSSSDLTRVSAEARDDLDAAAYELRVLAIREQIPREDAEDAFVLVGHLRDRVEDRRRRRA
jgi:hypothetical protein